MEIAALPSCEKNLFAAAKIQLFLFFQTSAGHIGPPGREYYFTSKSSLEASASNPLRLRIHRFHRVGPDVDVRVRTLLLRGIIVVLGVILVRKALNFYPIVMLYKNYPDVSCSDLTVSRRMGDLYIAFLKHLPESTHCKCFCASFLRIIFVI